MGNTHTCHTVDSSEKISSLMKHYQHYSLDNDGGSVEYSNNSTDSNNSQSETMSSTSIVKHHSIVIDEVEKSNPTLWRHYTVRYYVQTRFDAKSASLDSFLNQLSNPTLRKVESEFKTALLQYRLSKYQFPIHHHRHEKNDALHVSFIEDFLSDLPSLKKKKI